ncbi:MAG: 4Fe-4S cluster-binding domain-containing protein, partial [Candidatus Gastranaerophilaceae bacterium]
MLYIGGFQEFSLIDYPKKISCIVFMQGCNFRCGYCHNPELADFTLQSIDNNLSNENGVGCRGEAPTQQQLPLLGEGVGGGVN